ncbi:hypothetical protein [Bifidobacterium aquikefiri]|uniref:hypothetical protein n=1 Tax=Bifidobacterium aquikefiri TaxID=1653207 RepID=UPI0023EF7A32|nr:hypothetical protein [Bifidobacterium aquikefiri]
MKDVHSSRSAHEQQHIKLWSDRLSQMAEEGKLEPIKGSQAYRGEQAAAISDEDLLAVFQGRPREDEHQTTKKTWRIRTTQELDDWAAAGAREEHINTSALVRKAVAEYLEHHHRTALSA